MVTMLITDVVRSRMLLADAVQTSSPCALDADSLLLAIAGAFAAATHEASLSAKLWGAAKCARQRIGLEETAKYTLACGSAGSPTR